MNDQHDNDQLGETEMDRFDAGVAKAARETYHTPPETPRDEMWAVVQAARAAARDGGDVDVVPIRRFRPQPWWAAVAAALVIGVVLGRGTLGGGPDGAVTIADGTTDTPAASNFASSRERMASMPCGPGPPTWCHARTAWPQPGTSTAPRTS